MSLFQRSQPIRKSSESLSRSARVTSRTRGVSCASAAEEATSRPAARRTEPRISLLSKQSSYRDSLRLRPFPVPVPAAMSDPTHGDPFTPLGEPHRGAPLFGAAASRIDRSHAVSPARSCPVLVDPFTMVKFPGGVRWQRDGCTVGVHMTPETRSPATIPIRNGSHDSWWRRSFALPIGVLLLGGACGGDSGSSPAPAPSVPSAPAPAANRAPTAVGTIPEQVLTLGGAPTSLNVADNFADPDGDALSYRAVSDNTAVVQASVSGSVLTLTAAAAGTATVTVTASDPGGLTATQLVSVTVQSTEAANRAPTAGDHFRTGADPRQLRGPQTPSPTAPYRTTPLSSRQASPAAC